MSAGGWNIGPQKSSGKSTETDFAKALYGLTDSSFKDGTKDTEADLLYELPPPPGDYGPGTVASNDAYIQWIVKNPSRFTKSEFEEAIQNPQKFYDRKMGEISAKSGLPSPLDPDFKAKKDKWVEANKGKLSAEQIDKIGTDYNGFFRSYSKDLVSGNASQDSGLSNAYSPGLTTQQQLTHLSQQIAEQNPQFFNQGFEGLDRISQDIFNMGLNQQTGDIQKTLDGKLNQMKGTASSIWEGLTDAGKFEGLRSQSQTGRRNINSTLNKLIKEAEGMKTSSQDETVQGIQKSLLGLADQNTDFDKLRKSIGTNLGLTGGQLNKLFNNIDGKSGADAISRLGETLGSELTNAFGNRNQEGFQNLQSLLGKPADQATTANNILRQLSGLDSEGSGFSRIRQDAGNRLDTLYSQLSDETGLSPDEIDRMIQDVPELGNLRQAFQDASMGVGDTSRELKDGLEGINRDLEGRSSEFRDTLNKLGGNQSALLTALRSNLLGEGGTADQFKSISDQLGTDINTARTDMGTAFDTQRNAVSGLPQTLKDALGLREEEFARKTKNFTDDVDTTRGLLTTLDSNLGRDSESVFKKLLGISSGIDTGVTDNANKYESAATKFSNNIGFLGGDLKDNFGTLRTSLGDDAFNQETEANRLNKILRDYASDSFDLFGGLKTSLGRASTDLGGLGSGFQNEMTDLSGRIDPITGQFTKDITGLMGQGGLSGLRGDTSGRFNDLRSQLTGISQNNDPRYQAYQQSQFNLMDQNKNDQLRSTSEFFQRRGLGGSSAELNALNQIESDTNAQKQALAGQLGMQQIGRQDRAIDQLGDLAGRQAGIESGLIGQEGDMAGQVANTQLAGLNQRGDFARDSAGFNQGITMNQAGLASTQFGAGQDATRQGADFSTQGGQFKLGALQNRQGVNTLLGDFNRGQLMDRAGLNMQRAGLETGSAQFANQALMQGAGARTSALSAGGNQALQRAGMGANILGRDVDMSGMKLGSQLDAIQNRRGIDEQGFQLDMDSANRLAGIDLDKAGMNLDMRNSFANNALGQIKNREGMFGQMAGMGMDVNSQLANFAQMGSGFDADTILNRGTNLGNMATFANTSNLQQAELGRNLFGLEQGRFDQEMGTRSQLQQLRQNRLNQLAGMAMNQGQFSSGLLGNEINAQQQILANSLQGTGMSADLAGNLQNMSNADVANRMNAIQAEQGFNLNALQAGQNARLAETNALQGILQQRDASNLNMNNIQSSILAQQLGLGGNLYGQAGAFAQANAQADANALLQSLGLRQGLAGQQAGLLNQDLMAQGSLLSQGINSRSNILNQYQNNLAQQINSRLAGSQAISGNLRDQISLALSGSNARNNAKVLGLEGITAGLQNLTAPAQFLINELAAENAGKFPD